MKSRIASFRGCVLLAALLSTSSAVSARQCLYVGTDDTARVIDRTGSMFKPFPQALKSNACEKLRVVNGAVEVYPVDVSANQIHSIRVTRGPLMAASATDTGGWAGKAPIHAILVAVLEGNERMVSGSSRSAEADYLRDAIPVGRLVQPKEDLKIPLSVSVDPMLKLVELSSGGTTIYRQTLPSGTITLPAAIFSLHKSVQWRVLYGDETLTGELRLVDEATWFPTRLALEQKVSSETDPLLRQLRLAALMGEEGFLWDARKIAESALGF